MQYPSLLISIAAFIVSIFALLENRRSNRVAHLPALVGHESEDSVSYCYSIKNKGKGTAYFEKVEYFKNGELLVERTLRDAVSSELSKHGIRFQLTITTLGDESIMQSGEEMLLAKVVIPESDKEKLRFAKASATFAIRITYRSIHGKRMLWATNDQLLIRK